MQTGTKRVIRVKNERKTSFGRNCEELGDVYVHKFHGYFQHIDISNLTDKVS